ncbi:hypothetical protein BJV77DRAFT_1152515 [Russula vinacea]|nr:hypothetical protein BJV77DRAFT_1152515 [Russula vinacea]
MSTYPVRIGGSRRTWESSQLPLPFAPRALGSPAHPLRRTGVFEWRDGAAARFAMNMNVDGGVSIYKARIRWWEWRGFESLEEHIIGSAIGGVVVRFGTVAGQQAWVMCTPRCTARAPRMNVGGMARAGKSQMRKAKTQLRDSVLPMTATCRPGWAGQPEWAGGDSQAVISGDQTRNQSAGPY